jgi:hypothetical protein
MASTYSPLKIELIGTGEQAGTWGTTTNTNLGTAIEEALVGSADVTFASADVTLTLTDTNATQIARHLRLKLVGTSGGARNLILGSGCQIEKPYLIDNTLADAVTVKNTTGTGVAVPAGNKTFVYNDGTNVVDAITLSAGTVTSVSGTGTVNGISLSGTVTSSGNITLGGTLSNVNLTSQVTGTLPIANGGTGSTSTTFVNLATNVTGTLPVANGGTGITSFGTGVATWLGTPSSANLAAAVTDETGSGALVFATTPVLIGTREKSVAIAASDINLSLGNYFTRTISGATTLTVSNVASSGDVAAFILVLTNGGSATVTYFSGVTFAGGTAPALTASGVDILGFFTINGGTTWRGLVLALDIKAP